MNEMNTGIKLQTSKGCDEESENSSEDLGRAAETAGDLAFEKSGRDVLESTSGRKPLVEDQKGVESEKNLPTVDPVCGMTVDERTAVHIERDDKTFYFCSDSCKQKFLATIAGVKSDSKAGSCCGYKEQVETKSEL